MTLCLCFMIHNIGGNDCLSMEEAYFPGLIKRKAIELLEINSNRGFFASKRLFEQLHESANLITKLQITPFFPTKCTPRIKTGNQLSSVAETLSITCIGRLSTIRRKESDRQAKQFRSAWFNKKQSVGVKTGEKITTFAKLFCGTLLVLEVGTTNLHLRGSTSHAT